MPGNQAEKLAGAFKETQYPTPMLMGEQRPAVGASVWNYTFKWSGTPKAKVKPNTDFVRYFDQVLAPSTWPVWDGVTKTSVASKLQQVMKEFNDLALPPEDVAADNAAQEAVDIEKELVAAEEEDANIRLFQSQEPSDDAAPVPAEAGLENLVPHWEKRPEAARAILRHVYTLIQDIWDAIDEDAFYEFVSEYRRPFIKSLMDNSSHLNLYGLDDDGLLTPRVITHTIIGDLTYLRITSKRLGVVEGIIVLLYQAFRLNPELSPILHAIKAGADLSKHRHLLFLNYNIPTRSTPGRTDLLYHGPSVYALAPGWVDYDLVDRIRATGDWTLAACETGEEEETYGGMSSDSAARGGNHFGPKPVNHLVEAARRMVPRDLWQFHVVFKLFDSKNPLRSWHTFAKHILEHYVVVVFRLTDASQGGLNINMFDLKARITLFSHSNIKRFLIVLECALEIDHALRLPMTNDSAAWSKTALLIFGKELPPVAGVTLRCIAAGLHRTKLWNKYAGPRLRQFLKTHSLGDTAGNFALQPMSYQYYNYGMSGVGGVTNTLSDTCPPKVLDRWLQVVWQAVLEKYGEDDELAYQEL